MELVHQDEGAGSVAVPSFRNPVHFMPFAVGEAITQTEATLGVALHETDAVLDSYLLHPNCWTAKHERPYWMPIRRMGRCGNRC